jgi:hypothetical protein
MITMRRQLLGLGFVAASSLLALHSAQALTGPTAIQIDGGPLGPLQLSGGVDGEGYYVSNYNGKDDGADLGSGLVELQKSDGLVQFTIEVGSNGGTTTLGTGAFGQTSINTFVTGPLYAGYVTIAPPNSPVTFSAGQIGSLEGYESGIDWNNAVQLTTAIFYVQNSQSRGVEAAYTQGPISATVEYGDGEDSGAWNTVQALVGYTINPTNSVDVYATANIGRTGPYAYAYGQGMVGTSNIYDNSDMIGAYYSFTQGNLTLVPEVQFQYAKKDAIAGLPEGDSDFGAALFGNYAFGTSPYSIGAWAEYFTSHTPDGAVFIGPDSEAIGAAVAPTWQYKDLFARANAGYLYLLHNTGDGVTYGTSGGSSRGQFLGTVEAGLLF